MRRYALPTLLAGVLALAADPLTAQGPAALDSATLSEFRWRSIGPANMSGRITDVEGIPSPSKTFYVLSATGGLWKTTNNGTTFRLVWGGDGRTISGGDLAIAPSDTNVLYLGTGEEDSRNSISPGRGVFKSTDGGKTWTHVGLEKTEAIGRIVVHPTDPNTVWVAALGAIWRSNPERGLYKTTDGGKTWRLVKFISDKAGFVDVAIHPRDPNILFAASWERVRGPYFLQSGGPGSALWKSTDGGETWTKVQGGGWPESMLGRIGLAISPSHPDIMYAMVEADTMPNPRPRPGAAPQTRPSGLYRSEDGGRTWTRMNDRNVRPFYYSQVRVHPTNPNRVWFSSTPVNVSDDGGKTYRNATLGLHVDHHAMWIDPKDPDRHIVGNDGGIGISYDNGGTYDFPNTFAIGQFYNISYDMAVPYNVCGGLQDNGSWCGPSRLRDANQHVYWFTVNGGDGFHTQQDPTDPNIVYAESQGGNMVRVNLATGERVRLVKPSWRDRYMEFEDSIIVARGDTTRPPTAAQQRRIAELRAAQRADSAERDLRWNWNTPFILSHHNPSTLYAGANRVLKSTKRGDELFFISPDLTTRDTAAIRVSSQTTGGITPDVTGAEMYGTIVSLAESPIRPGLLYVGTDDGNVWITRNDGVTWENLTGRFPGLPARTYVSRIEPSHHDSATFYVTFDNHRRGDFTPYVYVTNDFGKTFRSIANDLPRGGLDFVHVIREDPKNRDLLFVGTDVGVYVSRDRGQHWQRFMTGLPTVPVHDLKIHPRDGELIAGTHGRSIWIVDITPLQQLTPTVAAKPAHLFKPNTAYQYPQRFVMGQDLGHRFYTTESPRYGADITVWLSEAPSAPGRLAVLNVQGDTLATAMVPTARGLHRFSWDFRGPRVTVARPKSPAEVRDSVRFAAEVNRVADSLVAAGMPRQSVDRVRTSLIAGQGLGGFGGGGGQGGQAATGLMRLQSREPEWQERPGESTQLMSMEGPVRPQAARGQAGQGAAEPDMSQLLAAFRPLLRGRGGGGFGGGGARGDFVAPGDYLVVLKIGDQEQRQVLRVERVGALADVQIIAGELEEVERDGEPRR